MLDMRQPLPKTREFQYTIWLVAPDRRGLSQFEIQDAITMSQYSSGQFGMGQEPRRATIKGPIDYKNAEELRRLMTNNGKIQSRKRLGLSAKEQKQITQAIKRARHMAILPFTNATA